MKLSVSQELEGFLSGIRHMAQRKGHEISPSGDVILSGLQRPGDLLVSKSENSIRIVFDRKIHFFRGLSLAMEHIGEASFEIREKPQFRMNGIMLDVSRGVVPKVEYIQEIISHMALMGLDMLMLYTEDIYEIPGEPYFGYMRGRYSFGELKACDDFADRFGIEIIPCIQTLGHMEQFLQWPAAKKYADTERVLLAGDESVYGFIDRAIAAASAPLRSKRIHIGMDEAKDIGFGKYLALHGFQNRFDIMNGHVARVTQLCRDRGLEPMMWSDMYFELTTRTGSFYDSEDVDPEVAAKIPEGMDFVYWDYYNQDKEFYRDFIRKHKRMGKHPIFAGGIWCWTNFGTDYDKTLKTTLPALDACREEGVREVFATLWGKCNETDFSTALMGLQLYAECGYSEKLDMEKLKQRTRFCTGIDYDDFFSLTKLYQLPGMETDFPEPPNPASSLLWQDPLMGLYDAEVQDYPIAAYFESCAREYEGLCRKSPVHEAIFRIPAQLSRVLAKKGDLGIRLKKAYDSGDREGLLAIAKEIPGILADMEQLRKIQRERYFSVNKPFGFDKCDLLLGGQMARLETTGVRIRDYLESRISAIEELEAQRLPFDGTEPGKYALHWRKYDHISTPHIQKFWT